MSDFNDRIIEEFRANGGRVGGHWEGRNILLLTTTGRKYVAPLAGICDLAERYDAIARPLDAEERNREFAAQVARIPVFGEYEQRTDRVIPVIALGREESP